MRWMLSTEGINCIAELLNNKYDKLYKILKFVLDEI
jgi:hypothetical protein